jgi:hypothetical protein
MLVKLPKVPAQLTLLLDIEILLVSEEYDTSRGNQAREIVLLSISKVGEVNAMNLGADFRVIVKDVCGSAEEILEGRVTQETFV